MEWAAVLAALLFALAGLVCLFSIPLGLPGTWILLGLAVLVELGDGYYLSTAAPVTFGWTPIGVGVALATLGEVVEAVAGAAGAKWGGASRRGTWGALLGGIAGGILLIPLFPVPLLGSLLGALLGSFLGALWGETTAERRRHPRESLRAAVAAALGRLAGTFGKLVLGVAMWVVLVWAAFV